MNSERTGWCLDNERS